MPGNPFRFQLPTQILYRAAVVEVIQDVDCLTPSALTALRSQLMNGDYLRTAPRNSCIVSIITAGQNKKMDQNILCYPLFPPHLALPVVPGEWVWIISEQSSFAPGTLPYWMCRVPANKTVTDLNFTHADRHFQTTVFVLRVAC